MEIKTLKGLNNNDILNVFNLSFSDYFIPFHLTQEQLTLKLLAENIDLELSVGVFEKGKLIAFILHGINNINGHKIIYNGGTGVVPNKRGQGLTKQMYHFILPILKEKGITNLFLEVISKNIQAIKSYEKSGYKTVRKLICYKGHLKTLKINNDLEIKKINNYNWNLMESFWDISPTWQNSKNTVNALKDENVSIGAYLQNQLIGYIIYNPNNKRLQQIAIDKKIRENRVASTLIHGLTVEFGNSLSIINVDKSYKPINLFFEKIGLKNFLEQIEMKLQLDTSQS